MKISEKRRKKGELKQIVNCAIVQKAEEENFHSLFSNVNNSNGFSHFKERFKNGHEKGDWTTHSIHM